MSSAQRSPRILVVEPGSEGEDSTARVLARVGYLVDQVAEASQGLARAEVEPPDLIVVGLDSPRSPGWELVEGVASIEPRPLVVALTSNPDYESFRRGVRLGIVGFQGHPCAEHELIAACQKALEPPDPGDGDERRASPRRRLAVEVEVLSPRHTSIALGDMVDFSPRGAQLELSTPVEPGSSVRIALAVHGTKLPLAVDGLVLWRRAGRRGLAHGVAFVDLPPETDRELHSLMGDLMGDESHDEGAAEGLEQAPAETTADRDRLPAAMQTLTSKQRQYLKGLAHALEPVVRVGKSGLTDSVTEETRRSLKAHELIKVRIDADNPERRELADQLAAGAEAHLVGQVGKVAILYRARDEEPGIQLPT